MQYTKGHSSLRRGRKSQIGFTYHVTSTTRNRTPYLSDFIRARQFIDVLREDEELGYTETLAFVVMPDHVHWLFELRRGSLPKSIKRIKSVFSSKDIERIWDYGFYDHGIRSDESLIKVARYIVANPLRAGLVDRVGDYPHWDSVWLE